ncbi:MAG: 23S rRNA (guanosine(2251)-2'-O)-methyltransferase RlmB [Bacteroidales bacterium]|nr:23S rRNA (guanosine(2251)-2'-O)-methyltransferase RlmB [Bacteroidales bacterium]
MQNDFIYGLNPVLEALDGNQNIDKILIRRGKNEDIVHQIKQLAKEHRVPFSLVPDEKLDRLTKKNHQGVIAFISPIPFYQIDDLMPQIFEEGRLPLIMILDGITDVRNFGAIARTCYSAGFDAIIIPSQGFARVSEDAVKTSAGALLKIPVCRTHHLADTIRYLQNSGVSVVAASEKAEQYYFNHDFSSPVAIVMGAEDVGVSEAAIRQADAMLKIPMANAFNSLNVSVAAGILAFEAVKQRL